MPIFLLDVFGSPSIGVFIKVTERFIIVPNHLPESKVKKLQNWFDIDVVRTNIGGSIVVGSLACANSHGIVLPHYIWDEELERLKTLKDVNITVADTKRTAFGNMVLANDYGAIVDPRLTNREKRIISDSLGVEVVSGEVAGLPYVGALTTATNKGVLTHPLVKPEEEKLLESILKVSVGKGTVNCGIPYIATGLIGNSKVAVAGSLTTGPEIFMIGRALRMDEQYDRSENLLDLRQNKET
ncbi:MAG: translation initiation factor IF-6 [Nitrososphaerota archaeon]|nr:translation initiation factor IF-6 [Candidatus Bathyarchaeota archaeon]MDW8048824.1 translation initiation factor IF-6 [Nitrososphaerota archaeon]